MALATPRNLTRIPVTPGALTGVVSVNGNIIEAPIIGITGPSEPLQGLANEIYAHEMRQYLKTIRNVVLYTSAGISLFCFAYPRLTKAGKLGGPSYLQSFKNWLTSWHLPSMPEYHVHTGKCQYQGLDRHEVAEKITSAKDTCFKFVNKHPYKAAVYSLILPNSLFHLGSIMNAVRSIAGFVRRHPILSPLLLLTAFGAGRYVAPETTGKIAGWMKETGLSAIHGAFSRLKNAIVGGNTPLNKGQRYQNFTGYRS